MNHNDWPLADMKIGLFGKGGSGKSTVTVLLAQTLQDRGYRVTVLDADSTNIGLSSALGIDVAPTPLMEYFGGAVFQGGAVSCPVDDPSRLAGAEIRWEDLPGNYCSRSPRGIRYLIAGKIADQGPGAGCDGPVAKIARDISLEPGGATPNVMLIDFKAGFEDSARGVITGIDWGVIVVDPTTASVHMADDMKLMLEDLRAGVPPATEHLDDVESADLMKELFRDATIRGLSFVLNRVDSEETEAYLRQALAQFGIEPAAVVPVVPDIAAAWLRGEPIDGRKVEEELFHELATSLGASVAEGRTAESGTARAGASE